MVTIESVKTPKAFAVIPSNIINIKTLQNANGIKTPSLVKNSVVLISINSNTIAYRFYSTIKLNQADQNIGGISLGYDTEYCDIAHI